MADDPRNGCGELDECVWHDARSYSGMVQGHKEGQEREEMTAVGKNILFGAALVWATYGRLAGSLTIVHMFGLL
jgi:hypothetical protein